MNRLAEELERMKEWDPDALVDALGIETEELLFVPEFYNRAVQWIEENNE